MTNGLRRNSIRPVFGFLRLVRKMMRFPHRRHLVIFHLQRLKVITGSAWAIPLTNLSTGA